MSKFQKIIVNRKNQEFKNIEYIPQVILLFKRFSRYLYDDYFENNKDETSIIIDLIEKTSPFFWAIIHKKSNKLAGFVFLENLVGTSDSLHSAEVTTCFNPSFWGSYTKICAKKFIKYCFKKFKFKKLKASVFSQNFKVKTLLKKAGFKKEAVLRGETLKNGRLQDIEIFSIINTENEVKNEIRKK